VHAHSNCTKKGPPGSGPSIIETLAYPLRRLAELALDRADYDKAAALCKESLWLNLDAGDKRAVAACLAGFAAIATARAQAVPAVRLYAAVEFLMEMISPTLLPADQHAYDRNVAALRGQLDEATFNATWAEGRRMTMGQAIVLALSLFNSEPSSQDSPST
jgi:hypothetical protein